MILLADREDPAQADLGPPYSHMPEDMAWPK